MKSWGTLNELEQCEQRKPCWKAKRSIAVVRLSCAVSGNSKIEPLVTKMMEMIPQFFWPRVFYSEETMNTNLIKPSFCGDISIDKWLRSSRANHWIFGPSFSSNIPGKRVGPSPIISVQEEGINTKALLDSWAQLTLLYHKFCEKHLKHVPMRKLEDLEFWYIKLEKFPCQGYLTIRLTFDHWVVGQWEAFHTLAIVCPGPPGANRSSLIMELNTVLSSSGDYSWGEVWQAYGGPFPPPG